MGDMWRAIQFLEKSVDNRQARSFIAIGPAMEAMMKQYLAREQGIRASGESLVTDYEIEMKLVKRSEPLSPQGKEAAARLVRELKLS